MAMERQPYAKSLADVSQEGLDRAGMGTVKAESAHTLGRLQERGREIGRGMELGERGLKFREKTLGERSERFAAGQTAMGERAEAGREFDEEMFKDRVAHQRQMQATLDDFEQAQFESFLDRMDEARGGKTVSGIMEIGGMIIGAMYGNASLGQSIGRGAGKVATGEEGFTSGQSRGLSLAGAALQGMSSFGTSRDLAASEEERKSRQSRDLDLATRYDEYRPSPRVEEDRWRYPYAR